MGKARVRELFGCQIETVNFYLRAEPCVSLDPVDFMARMEMNGQVFTTNSSDDELHFDSSVVVQAVPPFELKAADLTVYKSEPAYIYGGTYGTCYYYTPPEGIVFTYNGGLSNSVSFPREGDFFQTSFINGGTNGVGVKGGIVFGKDFSNQQLHINDVHHGANYPHNNNAFKYNERATIMRAIALRDAHMDLKKDSESIWTLWDNFGNSRSFILVQDGDYHLSLKDAVIPPSRFKVSTFKIFASGGQPQTDALYANNLHQCKIDVEIVKEEELPDSNWVIRNLTNEERDSLTVTLYSSDPQAALPARWAVDKNKNMFDTGLRQSGAEANVPGSDELQHNSDPRVEVIVRYMRCESGAPIESFRFMARIIIGGVIYTTYGFTGASFVTITPTRPYVIRASELVVNRYDVYSGAMASDLDIYYARPVMGGVRFLMNRGLDTPLSLPGEGLKFQSCYAHSAGMFSSRKIGVLLGDDVNAVVRFGDISNDGVVDPNVVIKADHHNTPMRIARLARLSIPFGSGDIKTPLRLIDNFGCEQAYYINQDEEGNVAYFTDYF